MLTALYNDKEGIITIYCVKCCSIQHDNNHDNSQKKWQKCVRSITLNVTSNFVHTLKNIPWTFDTAPRLIRKKIINSLLIEHISDISNTRNTKLGQMMKCFNQICM